MEKDYNVFGMGNYYRQTKRHKYARDGYICCGLCINPFLQANGGTAAHPDFTIETTPICSKTIFNFSLNLFIIQSV